jgi:hypothetical protein
MARRLKATPLETCVSLAILTGLAVVGIWLLVAQARFSPAVEVAAGRLVPSEAPSSSSENTELFETWPDGVSPKTPLESFVEATLSEKIDGKAELYLSAGFVSMRCQRLNLAEPEALWVEVFEYDMGDARNAFAVFSMQRRRESTDSPLTENAYATENAFYFTHGPYYYEAVASAASASVASALERLGRELLTIHGTGGAETAFNETDLFPTEGQEAGSVALIPSDAFGLAGFDGVFVARYGDGAATLFVTQRANAEEARKWNDAFRDYLLEYGGKRVEAGAGALPEGAWLVDLYDTFDAAFHRGPVLLGVHEAESAETAARYLRALEAQLARQKGATDE